MDTHKIDYNPSFRVIRTDRIQHLQDNQPAKTAGEYLITANNSTTLKLYHNQSH